MWWMGTGIDIPGDLHRKFAGINLLAPVVIFTVHTCNFVLEDNHLAPFHTWHSNAGIDWPRNSPADARNATLMEDSRHKTRRLRGAPSLFRFELKIIICKWHSTIDKCYRYVFRWTLWKVNTVNVNAKAGAISILIYFNTLEKIMHPNSNTTWFNQKLIQLRFNPIELYYRV